MAQIVLAGKWTFSPKKVGIIQKQNIGNAIGLNGFGNIFCIISRVDHDDSCIVRNQERNKTGCVGILEDHQHLFGFGSGIDNDFRMIAAKEYIVLAFGGQALNVKYGSWFGIFCRQADSIICGLIRKIRINFIRFWCTQAAGSGQSTFERIGEYVFGISGAVVKSQSFVIGLVGE